MQGCYQLSKLGKPRGQLRPMCFDPLLLLRIGQCSIVLFAILFIRIKGIYDGETPGRFQFLDALFEPCERISTKPFANKTEGRLESTINTFAS